MSAAEEQVYPNTRYREGLVPFERVLWGVVYFVPGLVLSRYTWPVIGLLWMLAGAGFLAVFVWNCFFPAVIIVDRDGFRLERKVRQTKILERIGYGKIHEARWIATDMKWRKLLGPLVFIEPIWPAQRGGSRRLVVSHAGHRLELREDEFRRLGEFVDTLRGRSILGLGQKDENEGGPRVTFGPALRDQPPPRPLI